jgi:hypothetical protein
MSKQGSSASVKWLRGWEEGRGPGDQPVGKSGTCLNMVKQAMYQWLMLVILITQKEKNQ